MKKAASGRSGGKAAQSGRLVPVTVASAPVDQATLIADLRTLIQSARQWIATVANSTTTLLFWNVGRRLLRENLQQGRAAYGKQILATVSQELMAEFGAGFSYTALTRLDAKSIRVSEYLTELPPLQLLRARLHQAIEHARERAVRRLPNLEGRQ